MKRIKYNGYINHLYVDIDLYPGLFIFDPESGAGKTLLCNKLIEGRSIFPNIAVYSYTHEVRYGRDFNMNDFLNADIVIIDRYDMLFPKYIKQIEELSKTKAVVLDYKGSDYIWPFDNIMRVASLTMSKREIEVYSTW